MNSQGINVSAEDSQFVTFLLGDEEYAVEALKVQEIMGLPSITKVPYMPSFIRGVINLRGQVIPVVDLRLKFGFPGRDYSPHTCAVVTRIGGNVMGMIVDSVSEVVSLSAESIDPAPQFRSRVRTGFMKAVGKIDKRLLIILDAERILTDDEMASLEATMA